VYYELLLEKQILCDDGAATTRPNQFRQTGQQAEKREKYFFHIYRERYFSSGEVIVNPSTLLQKGQRTSGSLSFVLPLEIRPGLLFTLEMAVQLIQDIQTLIQLTRRCKCPETDLTIELCQSLR